MTVLFRGSNSNISAPRRRSLMALSTDVFARIISVPNSPEFMDIGLELFFSVEDVIIYLNLNHGLGSKVALGLFFINV